MPLSDTPNENPLYDADRMCSRKCMRIFDLWVDGEPYCFDCAEEWFDRLTAIENYPALREMLPMPDA